MKPLYNDNVRQPVGMFVILLLVVLAITFVLGDLFVDSIKDCAIPEILLDVEIHPSSYTYINSDSLFYISTDDDVCVYAYTSSVSNIDELFESVAQKETLYGVGSKYPDFWLWELRGSDGTVYISIESTRAAAKEFAVRDCTISTIMLLLIWGFFIGSTYLLYNAPRYPRLARLLVREEFRNF